MSKRVKDQTETALSTEGGCGSFPIKVSASMAGWQWHTGQSQQNNTTSPLSVTQRSDKDTKENTKMKQSLTFSLGKIDFLIFTRKGGEGSDQHPFVRDGDETIIGIVYFFGLSQCVFMTMVGVGRLILEHKVTV